MQYIYVHGFASSPQSRKALAFEAAFAQRGLPLAIPAMDEGDFESLTISGQLDVLNRARKNEPVPASLPTGCAPTDSALIGSSMGGLVAALYASNHPDISRLVLLAPAFGFAPRWREKAGDPPPASMQIYHYRENRMRQIRYGLIEDALKYPAAPDFAQPALIFHGIHDDTVPIENSRAYAATHPNVRLIELDSDHELLTVLDRIVAESMCFLLG